MSPDSIRAQFFLLVDNLRFGGYSERGQWHVLFDPKTTDLSKLPIGVLETKALLAPNWLSISSEEALICFCEQLIDRGRNAELISLFIAGWPDGWTLSDHVSVLWATSVKHPKFFKNVVNGRHGTAISYVSARKRKGLSCDQAKGMLLRQGLLWCAMDVQLTACRGRASLIAPMGNLFQSNLRQMKGGSVLGKLRLAMPQLKKTLADFKTADELRSGGENIAVPSGKYAKIIAHRVRSSIPTDQASIAKAQLLLEETIPTLMFQTYVDAAIEWLNEDMGTPAARASNGGIGENTNRLFHAIWYSGLSAAAGLSVSVIRYVIAEQHLTRLIDRAFDMHAPSADPSLKLSLLPDQLERLMAYAFLGEQGDNPRVLDLVRGSRVVHLQDVNLDTRMSEADKASLQTEGRTVSVQRDPTDKAGRTFINEGYTFLARKGVRVPGAHQIHNPDPSDFTYWLMDVVPEVRLVA